MRINCKLTALALLCATGLTGCFLTSPLEDMTKPEARITVVDTNTQEVVTIDPISYANKLQAQMAADCRSWQRQQDENKWGQVDKLGEEAKLTAIVSQQWSEALIAINGKDACKPGTNSFDAYVAYAQAEGKIFEVGVTELGKTLRFTAGAVAAANIVENVTSAIGDKLTNSSKVESGTNGVIANESPSVSPQSTNSAEQLNSTAVNTGEGSQSTTLEKTDTTTEIVPMPVTEVPVQ